MVSPRKEKGDSHVTQIFHYTEKGVLTDGCKIHLFNVGSPNNKEYLFKIWNTVLLVDFEHIVRWVFESWLKRIANEFGAHFHYMI